MTTDAPCPSNSDTRFFKLDERHSVHAQITTTAPPTNECYAVLYKSEGLWKVGRFWPGEAPMFASDASSPADMFRGVEKLRRRRPVDLKEAWVFPVLGMYRSVR